MRNVLFSLLIFLFVSLVILFATTHLSSFSSSVSSPFSFLANTVSPLRSNLYAVSHAEGKPSDFEKLTIENNKLRAQLVTLESLKKDNAALSSQFQDDNISSQKLIPAHIVGFKGIISSPDTFILDIGEKSGVKKGMAAIIGNSLVGQIIKVTPYFSELILVTNKNFSTLAFTSNNNSSGIITGEDDFLLLDHVVITDTVSKNDTVVTKGEEDVNGVGIPENLVIGKIISVNKSEASPFQSAILKSLLNFSKINMVFIVM